MTTDPNAGADAVREAAQAVVNNWQTTTISGMQGLVGDLSRALAGTAQPSAEPTEAMVDAAVDAFSAAVNTSWFQDHLDHRHTVARHRAGLRAVLAAHPSKPTGVAT